MLEDAVPDAQQDNTGQPVNRPDAPTGPAGHTRLMTSWVTG